MAKHLSLIYFLLKAVIVLLGVALFLFVSNIIHVTYSNGIVANGDTLHSWFEEARQNSNIKVTQENLFTVGFSEADWAVGISGVFNPLAQLVVAFMVGLAAFTLLALCKRTKPQNTPREMLIIAAKSLGLVGALVTLDTALHNIAAPPVFIAVFFVVALSYVAGVFLNRIEGEVVWKQQVEFCVALLLLLAMLMMNHTTYCAQLEFSRPFLGDLTAVCSGEKA